MEPLRAGEQHRLVFAVVRIGHADLLGAHRVARLDVVEADALGAQRRVDREGVLALADGLVGALGRARAAVDALRE